MGIYRSTTEWARQTHEARANKRRRDFKQLRKELVQNSNGKSEQIIKSKNQKVTYVPPIDQTIQKLIVTILITIFLSLILLIWVSTWIS